MLTIRPELSKKNKYWIDKHRYYELKHRCLQYETWKKEYKNLDGFRGRFIIELPVNNTNTDPTLKMVEIRMRYIKKIEIIEKAATKTDPKLYRYILKAVTEGLSYNVLKIKYDIPCSRDTYYDRYRRFFWILDNLCD